MLLPKVLTSIAPPIGATVGSGIVTHWWFGYPVNTFFY